MPEAAPCAAAWRLVVALGVTQIVSWGTLYYAFALVIDGLAQAVAAPPAVVVGAFSGALLAAGLASAPVGRLIDRQGGRTVMTLGSVAAGLLLALLSQVTRVWQLYALWALLGVTMAATLYDPAFAVLGQVFQSAQRKAITALTLFGGFASTVFWPVTQAAVQHLGWQGALLALGLLNLLVCAPLHAACLPRAAPPLPVGGPAAAAPPRPGALLRDPVFLGLCGAFTGNALVFSAMSVHLLPLLQAKGLSLADAAWIGALIGPMQVLGRVLEYTFLGRWKPSRVGQLAMWLLPLSLGLLALLPGGWPGLALFALLYGSGNGVMTIVRGAIPAELYGRQHYGAVNGAMAAPVLLAKAAGPIAASLVLGLGGGPATVVLGLAAVGAISASVFAGAVRWRRPPPEPAAATAP
ncbi:MFS transporter [Aquabacterium sp.]|uniref:MFS transporter n=1 Tax=Aquabacterium sp. TaxID=1872578 RepID=UPI003783AA6D